MIISCSSKSTEMNKTNKPFIFSIYLLNYSVRFTNEDSSRSSIEKWWNHKKNWLYGIKWCSNSFFVSICFDSYSFISLLFLCCILLNTLSAPISISIDCWFVSAKLRISLWESICVCGNHSGNWLSIDCVADQKWSKIWGKLFWLNVHEQFTYRLMQFWAKCHELNAMLFRISIEIICVH